MKINKKVVILSLVMLMSISIIGCSKSNKETKVKNDVDIETGEDVEKQSEKENLNNEDEIFKESEVSKENETLNEDGKVIDKDKSSKDKKDKSKKDNKENKTEGKSEEVNQEDEQYKILNEKRTLKGLKDNFTKNGLNVGDNQLLVYTMPYAYDGLLFEVNGQSIEIYKYNLEKPYPGAETFIEQAKAGLVYINDEKVKVDYNDGIVIMNHLNHKDKNKIMQIFNNY